METKIILSDFKVLRGGCNTKHPTSFKMLRPNGLSNYLILIIKSECIFTISNQTYALDARNAIIISPDTPYSYYNPNGHYMDDWLHFEAPKDFFKNYISIEFNKPFRIRNIAYYNDFIKYILWEETYNNSNYKDKNISHLFSILFNYLSTDFTNKNSDKDSSIYEEALQNIRLSMQNSVANNHSIKEYSKSLGISESYFQLLYKDKFKISFQQDLIKMRIDYAKHLISTTDTSISIISNMCGYNNEIHFYRQFKKLEGCLPSSFRKL